MRISYSRPLSPAAARSPASPAGRAAAPARWRARSPCAAAPASAAGSAAPRPSPSAARTSAPYASIGGASAAKSMTFGMSVAVAPVRSANWWGPAKLITACWIDGRVGGQPTAGSRRCSCTRILAKDLPRRRIVGVQSGSVRTHSGAEADVAGTRTVHLDPIDPDGPLAQDTFMRRNVPVSIVAQTLRKSPSAASHRSRCLRGGGGDEWLCRGKCRHFLSSVSVSIPARR